MEEKFTIKKFYGKLISHTYTSSLIKNHLVFSIIHQTLMSYKLLIAESINLALIYSENKILNLMMEHRFHPLDKIYLGRISSLVPSLNAAFIHLTKSSKKNGFIHINSELKEIQQKKVKSSGIWKGKNFLVQVVREPIGNKSPTVSININLTGSCITLQPFYQDYYQRKAIYNEEKIDYIEALGYLLRPKNLFITLRKESVYVNPNFLIRELNYLKKTWTEIIKKSKICLIPSAVIKKENFLYKILKQYGDISFESIYIDSYEGCIKLKKILTNIQNHKNNPHRIKIQYYRNRDNLIEYSLLDKAIYSIIKPRIDLYTGGYIVIEKTEALTAIDINSGSFKSLSNSNQTSLWINYLAVYEIARQIQLRNIGGIIIVDFIDSKNQNHQMKILKYMNKLLKKDYIKCNIVQISELGLLEITRMKQKQNVYDAFTSRCKLCNGSGSIALPLAKNKPNFYPILLSLYPV